MPYYIVVPPGAGRRLRKVIQTINFLRALPEDVEYEIFDEELGFTVIKRMAPLNRINVGCFNASPAIMQALEQALRQAGIEPRNSGPGSLYFSAYPT